MGFGQWGFYGNGDSMVFGSFKLINVLSILEMGARFYAPSFDRNDFGRFFFSEPVVTKNSLNKILERLSKHETID